MINVSSLFYLVFDITFLSIPLSLKTFISVRWSFALLSNYLSVCNHMFSSFIDPNDSFKQMVVEYNTNIYNYKLVIRCKVAS